MSLSQKHADLAIVPWFNKNEWYYAYRLLFATGIKDWSKAVKLLQVWKLRGPQLSAGVEGTLVLLQALIVPPTDCYATASTYATSLLRFLNLCVANSKKPTSFSDKARQHRLPQWLISLRHDIAHQPNLPSVTLLRMALEYCLRWIRIRYWIAQRRHLHNRFVKSQSTYQLKQWLYIYLALINNEDIDNAKLFERLNTMFNGNVPTNKAHILIVARELIGKFLDKIPHAGAIVINIITQKLVCVPSEEKHGEHIISKKILRNWIEPLNLIHNHKLMPSLVKCLLYGTLNENEIDEMRLSASLWLKNIYKMLNRIVKHDSKNAIPDGFNIELLKSVFQHPTRFNHIFIKDMMILFNQPEHLTDLAVMASKVCVLDSRQQNEQQLECPGEIYTICDVKAAISAKKRQSEVVDGESAVKCNIWRKITDTYSFTKCPLGVLPGQSTYCNPSLMDGLL